jgi:predicted dehydrogenase
LRESTDPAPRVTANASGGRELRGIAFLGCGQAAALHSRTLARLEPDLPRLYASRSAEKARAYAGRHGGVAAYGGYDEALRDERASAALVVTPPRLHLEATLAALSAGKDVIVEKPAFIRSDDFHAVADAAEAAGRRVLVAENYAYKPLLGELRRIVRDEVLGRVLFLSVNALKHQAAGSWRADASMAGGGALLEGGIHWISLLARIGPRVTEVRALSPDRAEPSPERSMQLLLGYEQGLVASLSYSWSVPSPLKGLRLSRIYGTEGSATFESNGLFVAAFGRGWRVRLGGGDLMGYRAMFRDFLGALRSGGPSAYTLDDARRDVELVEDAYRSAGLPVSTNRGRG